MKIGYFTTSFPYKNPVTGKMIKDYVGGGVENVSYNLTVEMAKRGHEVHVFTSSMDSKESVENYGNITIHRYKKSFMIGSAPIPLDILYKPLKLGIDLDIVHAHVGNLPAPLTAYWYAKRRKKPFIITHHGEWMGDFGGLTRRACVFIYNKYISNKLYSAADVIIALSNFQVEGSNVLTKYEEKVRIIPNGIHLEEFNIPYSKEKCREMLSLPPDKKIILFVGSLTPRKAPHILLKAMEKIIKEVPDTYLVLVGDGMMRKELEEMIMKLKINQNVKFAGFITDQEEKTSYYKSADVLVLPSLFSEAFPIVLLEASACELPLVVSDLGVFKAIVKEGYNGLFSETGSENDLADKIIYLLENKDIERNLGKNAGRKVKEFSWERVAEETTRVYGEVINGH